MTSYGKTLSVDEQELRGANSFVVPYQQAPSALILGMAGGAKRSRVEGNGANLMGPKPESGNGGQKETEEV